MLAALLALGGAVVTAAAYVWLTERLDYATVDRRQLDAWVAISAVAFLFTIVYGGAEVRQAALARTGQPLAGPSSPPVQEIRRLHQPSLDPAVPSAPVEAAVAEERPPDLDLAPMVVDGGPVVPALQASRSSSDEGDRPEDASDAPLYALDPLPLRSLTSPVEPTLTVVARVGAPQVRQAPIAATDPPAPPVVRPAVITVEPPTPTRMPPTPVPPTSQPTDVPPPTPHCGDPNRIDVRIEIREAEAVRRGQPQAVRYSSRVRNETDFPLNLTDIAATAQDSRSGSDQFGSDRKSDVTVAPGQWAEIEGTITLEKFPSPFGRSELCLSFVPETCGERNPQRAVSRRCVGISGF